MTGFDVLTEARTVPLEVSDGVTEPRKHLHFIQIEIVCRPCVVVPLEKFIDRQNVERPREDVMNESRGSAGVHIETVRVCRPGDLAKPMVAKHKVIGQSGN